MIAAVLLLLGGAALWIVFFTIQLAIGTVLFTLLLGLAAGVAVYGCTFLGLFLIFGQANAGWAIFGAMFLGTVICREALKAISEKSA